MLTMDTETILALNRFGMGRRPDEPPPDNPRAWLRAQLAAPDPTPMQGAVDTATALGVVRDRIGMRQAEKQAAQAQPAPPVAGAPTPAPEKAPNPIGELARREMHDFLGRALITPAPFRERLVWFWANHFTIVARSQIPAACCGAFVREAIRPYVTGRFADMLLAVMRHPAMISYLNQEQSAGPDSRAGQRRHLGLNENLARESLELHTVSPAAGYTQADVTNYARVLTGWSIDIHDRPGFMFRPNMHEPGEIEVMGRTWPEGERGGVAILAWLGTHPATYRHLADKLTRHFVADEPPPAQVRRIEAVLTETQGDLGAASDALIGLPGAWVPGAKLRTPQDFAIACLRAVGATPDHVPNLPQIVNGLGQGAFQAPFPIGWPDRAADWAGPEAMLERVDYAYGLSGRAAAIDPEQLGHAVLGPLLTEATLGQIRAAGSRRDGLTLLLASPEFQRR
jgi:uncharacterized protein (DUF1800 family)